MGTMARPITAVVAIWSQVCREHALAQLRQAGVACETAALDPTLRSRIEAVDPGLLVIEGGSVPFDVVGLLRDLRRSTAVQSMPIILLVSYRFQYDNDLSDYVKQVEPLGVRFMDYPFGQNELAFVASKLLRA